MRIIRLRCRFRSARPLRAILSAVEGMDVTVPSISTRQQGRAVVDESYDVRGMVGHASFYIRRCWKRRARRGCRHADRGEPARTRSTWSPRRWPITLFRVAAPASPPRVRHHGYLDPLFARALPPPDQLPHRRGDLAGSRGRQRHRAGACARPAPSTRLPLADGKVQLIGIHADTHDCGLHRQGDPGRADDHAGSRNMIIVRRDPQRRGLRAQWRRRDRTGGDDVYVVTEALARQDPGDERLRPPGAGGKGAWSSSAAGQCRAQPRQLLARGTAPYVRLKAHRSIFFPPPPPRTSRITSPANSAREGPDGACRRRPRYRGARRGPNIGSAETVRRCDE